MHWEKKICFRLTTRRIVGAILVATTVANLVIVGAVFGADSPSAALTVTSTLTTLSLTSTFSIPSSTAAVIFTPPQTSRIPPTYTSTPTETFIDPPIWPCIKRFYWPIYRVQLGDTIFSLASIIGSSVEELMSANCLTSDQIYNGQPLHVRRLPGRIPAPMFSPTSTDTSTPTSTDTPTYTPTPTPTDTPTDTPTNMPTVFLDPDFSLVLCPDYPYTNISTKVTPKDPQGVSSVFAFYNINNGPWLQIYMGPDGDTYYGSGYDAGRYSTLDAINYRFIAIDMLRVITTSSIYSISPIDNCLK